MQAGVSVGRIAAAAMGWAAFAIGCGGGGGAPASPPASSPTPTACSATRPATSPVAAPYRLGFDEIVAGHLYVVYSGLERVSSRGAAANTANIFVIKGVAAGTSHEIWIFGAGYGDAGGDVRAYRGDSDAMRSAAADARDVDAVVRNCMALDSERVALRFVAPHFHLDHANQEFFSALEALGYDLARLEAYVHFDDAARLACNQQCCGEQPCTSRSASFGAPYSPPWRSELIARFRTVGRPADRCGTEALSFLTEALGRVAATSDHGHTEGSLNLDIEARRLRLNGAEGVCDLPAGWTELRPHGNVVVR